MTTSRAYRLAGGLGRGRVGGRSHADRDELRADRHRPARPHVAGSGGGAPAAAGVGISDTVDPTIMARGSCTSTSPMRTIDQAIEGPCRAPLGAREPCRRLRRLPPSSSAGFRREQRDQRLPSITAGRRARRRPSSGRSAVGSADVDCVARGDAGHAVIVSGSITKTFTAAAIMQLRDAGKLDLEDPLDKHV